MKKGTQAMLDAANDDATLLPYKKVFKTKIAVGSMPFGTKVVRGALNDEDFVGNERNVAFEAIDGSNYEYYGASELAVCKPKKWKNGTQAQLDAAKDDARLIPKKTFYMSRRGDTKGMHVYKIDDMGNDESSVMMMSRYEILADFLSYNDLEPIND